MSEKQSLTAAIAVTLLLLAAIGWRISRNYQPPGRFESERQGFCDFHNGVFFPAVAFSEGTSPFGAKYEAEYPVARALPIHAPYVFLIHLPYAGLPLRVAEFVHFAAMTVQVIAIAYLSLLFVGIETRWSRVFWLTAGIIATRAGYGTLFTGYFTFELVLGAICALHFADRHWLGAAGLTLCFVKPTYGLPIVILLAARGQWRTVVWGISFAIVLSLASLTWLDWSSSLSDMKADMEYAQAQHLADPNEMPENSWTRIDILGIVAKWSRWIPSDWEHLVWMFPLIAVPTVAIWRVRGDVAQQGLASVAGFVSSCAVLSSVYHHYYDLIALVPSLLGVAFAKSRSFDAIPILQRRLVALAGGIVLFNYLSAQLVLANLNLSKIWFNVVTTVNGVVLFGLLCWGVFWLLRLPRRNGS